MTNQSKAPNIFAAEYERRAELLEVRRAARARYYKEHKTTAGFDAYDWESHFHKIEHRAIRG